jgi:Predicted transcriptional regulators
MKEFEHEFQIEMEPCPVEVTLRLISNKWKVLILRELLTGTKRFNELKNGIGGVSQKVLTQNLRSMEGGGIITRVVFPEVPPRVEYSLSDLGDSLKPIIAAMEVWGMDYLEKQK